MAVVFMNNVSRENHLLSTQSSDIIQGQITTYLMQLINEKPIPPILWPQKRNFCKASQRAIRKSAEAAE